MSVFTEGKWRRAGPSDRAIVVEDDGHRLWLVGRMFTGPRDRLLGTEEVPEAQADGNGQLVIAAGTAATALESRGYDGQAAIEALPALVEIAMRVLDLATIETPFSLIEAARDVAPRIRKGGE